MRKFRYIWSDIKWNLSHLKDIPRNLYLGIKYPFLKGYGFPYITWQDSVPTGWKKITMQMWEEIRQEMKHWSGSKVHIMDLKEKYGYLDLDMSGPNSVHQIVEKYEYISARTCIKCGRPAKYFTPEEVWNSPYCDKCFDSKYEDISMEYYKDTDWYGYKKC